MFAGKDLSASDAVLVAIAGMLVVVAELALLSVCIRIISKVIRAVESRRKAGAPSITNEAQAVEAQVAAAAPLPGTVSLGSLTLIDTDEPTAAVIMAVVSDMSGIDLNHLNFKTIKRIGD